MPLLLIAPAGQEIALKATQTSKQLWMSCEEGDCRLNGCPGNRFKADKRVPCSSNVFSLQNLDSSSKIIKIGDKVALRHEVNGVENTVYCVAGVSCIPSTRCEMNGKFSEQLCSDQVLVVTVPGKSKGAILKHKDEIILEYQATNEQDSSIGCSLDNPRVCQRDVCILNQFGSGDYVQPTGECVKHQFIVHKLL